MASKRKLLSQVFLQDPHLVKKLISNSSIKSDDIVIEVGPGMGIITKLLAHKAKKVIAIEKDISLYKRLKINLAKIKNIELIKFDALEFEFPDYDYKVFANIPFHIEGQFVRKLINSSNPPKDTYLVMRKEVAERMAGIPKDGQFSIIHKPMFDLSIFYRFRRSDFKPKPRVESVMLRIRLREKLLIPLNSYELYKKFIIQGFGGGRRIKQNLSPMFSKTQLVTLANKLRLNLQSKPSDIKLEQWINLFEFWKQKAQK